MRARGRSLALLTAAALAGAAACEGVYSDPVGHTVGDDSKPPDTMTVTPALSGSWKECGRLGTGGPWKVAISGDGGTAAVLFSDGQIAVQRLADGATIAQLRSFIGPPPLGQSADDMVLWPRHGLALSDDGAVVAVADGTHVAGWRTRDGTVLFDLAGLYSHVSLSPRGDRFIAWIDWSDAASTFELRSSDGGALLHGHPGVAAGFTRDPDQMVVVADAKVTTLRVSDAATDVVGEVALAAIPTSPILSPDGQYVAALSPYLADVQMYRTSDGTQVWDQPVTYGDMKFSPDGGALLVHEAASLFVVDVATGAGTRRPLDQVRDAAVGPGGTPVLIADVSGLYRADDVQAPLATFPTLPGQGSGIMALAVSPDQRSLAAASDRRIYPATPISPVRAHPEDVLLWNLQDATLTRTFSGLAATSVEFSPDSRRLMIASRYEQPDGRLEEWALDGVAPTWSLTVAGSAVYGASYSPAGRPIAVSFADGVGVLPDGTGAVAPTLAREILYPASAFSPDGGRLVTSGMTLWKTTNLTPIWTTAALPPAPTDATSRDNWLAFSPDGSLIVSSESESSDETGALNRTTTTKLYRAADGVLFRDLGTDFERRAVFSPDGKWLLAADHAWEVATGRQAFMHPDPRPTSVSTFLADGRIVLGRNDGVIEIFCPH